MLNNPLYVVVLMLSVIAGTLASRNQKVTVIIEPNPGNLERHTKTINMAIFFLIGLCFILSIVPLFKHLFHM